MPLPALRIQTLDDLEQVVKQYVLKEKKSGNNPSLSGIYGYVRKLGKYSFFGDYPLLSRVCYALKNLGCPPTKKKLLSVINRRCDDLKGRYLGKKSIVQALVADL